MSSIMEKLVLKEDFSVSVFSTPSGVTSYIHDNISVVGNPMMTSTTTNVSVQSGRYKAGNTILHTCMRTKAKAA